MDLLVGLSSPLTKPARSQKRQVIGIFADQHMGERHPVGAGPAGIFRADRDDDTELGGDDVQPLAAILADLVHDTAAAGADQAGGFDDFFDARQCSRQVADGALWCGPDCPFAPFGGTGFLLSRDFGQGDGQVLEGELPFILGQLLGPFAMQGVVLLGD